MSPVQQSRKLIYQRQMAMINSRRLMSTQTPHIRRAGMSKGAIATLFVAAAGFAYYKRSSDEQNFYQGDTDPYEHIKKTASDLGNKVPNDAKHEAHGAVDELNAAGQHVKNSANLAGQAAKDTFNSASHTLQKEGHNAAESAKDKADALRAKASSKAQDLKSDANEAAFKAANKLKEAKEDIKHNPMVHEKLSSNKTKSAFEHSLESHAHDNVKDTSGLVGKDTDKVKPVWNDKNVREESLNGHRTTIVRAEEPKGFWASIFGSSGSNDATNISAPANADVAHQNLKPSAPRDPKEKKTFDTASTHNGNPMVHEKHSAEPTKPAWETRMEEHAHNNVRDTSTLVGKDTEKVRGVWDEKAIRDNGGVPVVQENPNSFWSSLFGKAKEAEHKFEERLEDGEEKAAGVWEGVKAKVGIKANDVKEDAHEAYQDAKGKAASEANQLKRDANDLSSKAQHEANRLESSWEQTKSQVKGKAQSAYESAADTASSLKREASNKTQSIYDSAADTASSLKREASYKSEQAQDKAEQLKREASDRLEAEKARANSSMKDLHNEVSANASKWKNETDQTVKSWYQKGTEQVKSGIETVKNVADRDLHWAEEKVNDGIAGAKEEVDRLFGKAAAKPKQQGYVGHVVRGEKFAEEEEGMLKATRPNTKLKPAEVIVENSDGKDM